MLRVEVPSSAVPERAYAIDFILGDVLGLEYTIVAGAQRGRTVIRGDVGVSIIVPDAFFDDSESGWMSIARMPQTPLRTWDADSDGLAASLVRAVLPILYPSTWYRGQLIQRERNAVTLHMDIFGSAFFMLTRLEEFLQPEMVDAHGRFPASASLAFREGFLDRPILDEYTEILWACLKQVFPGLTRKTHRYEVVPTHDLDRPLLFSTVPRFCRAVGSHVIHGRPALAGEWVAQGVKRIFRGAQYDPFAAGLPRLLEMSEEHGLASQVNVMGAYADGHDNGYDPGGPIVSEMLKDVLIRGHCIGFHPGYSTPRDFNRFQAEKNRVEHALGIPVDTGRQHYLRVDLPDTWEIWERAGMDTDSSLGYADANGFRCGTCKNFRLFHLTRRTQMKVWESPLIVMDGTLRASFDGKHRINAAVESAAGLADACRKVNGQFVVLWHNSSFFGEWRGWERAYRDILSEALR